MVSQNLSLFLLNLEAICSPSFNIFVGGPGIYRRVSSHLTEVKKQSVPKQQNGRLISFQKEYERLRTKVQTNYFVQTSWPLYVY